MDDTGELIDLPATRYAIEMTSEPWMVSSLPASSNNSLHCKDFSYATMAFDAFSASMNTIGTHGREDETYGCDVNHKILPIAACLKSLRSKSHSP